MVAKNAEQLKLKYNIPVVDPNDGYFTIIFWDIGDGYKEEKPKQDWMFPSVDTSYLMCFDDMKSDANCVEKNNLLSISRYRDPWRQGKLITDFSIENNIYRQYSESQEIIKTKRN